jgi:hypothetical protein
MAKLRAVVAEVNQKNINGAIRTLQAFIGEVNALIKTGEGRPLTEAARDIISQFGS